jgi:hypothetical protein
VAAGLDAFLDTGAAAALGAIVGAAAFLAASGGGDLDDFGDSAGVWAAALSVATARM